MQAILLSAGSPDHFFDTQLFLFVFTVTVVTCNICYMTRSDSSHRANLFESGIECMLQKGVADLSLRPLTAADPVGPNCRCIADDGAILPEDLPRQKRRAPASLSVATPWTGGGVFACHPGAMQTSNRTYYLGIPGLTISTKPDTSSNRL
jgi:hypothetical protein